VTETPVGPDHQVFQKIVDLDTREAVGYEVLSRFAGIDPAEAFAAARADGTLLKLDLACIGEAIKAFPHLPHGTFLDVNIDPATMIEVDLLHLLLDNGVPPHRLILEITENAELDYLKVYEPTWRLRQRGVRLALDDMGKAAVRLLEGLVNGAVKVNADEKTVERRGDTAYGRIVQMLPNVLKIDRELIDGIERSPIQRALVRSMVGMGSDLAAIVVAEGVETQAEVDWLRTIGVHFGQGYWLHRPMRLEELLA
jgi:EAL domain-containing protein (putative c-di-GMP-specific phosphodiesterase class I)